MDDAGAGGHQNMEWNALNQPRNDQQQKQEPANIERDIQIPRNADGSLDGGVAVPPESNKSAATECDLVRSSQYIFYAHFNVGFFSTAIQDAIPRVYRAC
jgi:hypothetical protein